MHPDRPTPSPVADLTAILSAASAGDADAARRLMPLVYEELHALARARMSREGAGHTLQTTALVHEAYMRLLGAREQNFENRAHFFGAAAEAMRRILVDHARAKSRAKRGSGRTRIALDDDLPLAAQDPAEVLSLDRVLSALEAKDPRLAEIVKLRCFVGMTIAEVAAALGVSTRTVNRDWLAARAWLKGALADLAPETGGGAEA
jgi:RNA polymerase sigma factor (TIGR02999 family)